MQIRHHHHHNSAILRHAHMQVAIKEAHRRPAMLDSTSFLILSIVFFYVKRAVETVAVPRFRPFLVAAFL